MFYLERGAADALGIFCDETIQLKRSAKNSTSLSTGQIWNSRKGDFAHDWNLFSVNIQAWGICHTWTIFFFQPHSPVLRVFPSKQATKSGHRTSPTRVHLDCFSISDLEQAQLCPHCTPICSVTITFTDPPELLSQNHKKKNHIN